MTDAQQQALLDRVEHCYTTLERFCGVVFPRPSVSFRQRGKIAGSARLQLNELRFNPVLFSENPDAFLTEIVPHEVCHLATYSLYGRVRPHGREWKSLMRDVFNLDGHVTHRLDTRSVQGRTVNYSCACGDVPLSIRRHNKVIRRQTVYHCRQCGERLVQTAR